MGFITEELRHNTDEQVREYLSKARDLVAELELTDELAPIAFTKAVDLFAAKQVMATPTAAAALGDGLIR